MGALREIKRHSLAAVVPVVCFIAIAYFGFHAVEGEHGLNAYGRVTLQIQEAKSALAEITLERQQLERRVNLLRKDALDTDMVEEQAHRLLGLLAERELVILNR